jgi:hypothetical protein
MGQYEKSIGTVSGGILPAPKPIRYSNRGYGYLAFGKYTAALADTETGISLNAIPTTTWA